MIILISLIYIYIWLLCAICLFVFVLFKSSSSMIAFISFLFHSNYINAWLNEVLLLYFSRIFNICSKICFPSENPILLILPSFFPFFLPSMHYIFLQHVSYAEAFHTLFRFRKVSWVCPFQKCTFTLSHSKPLFCHALKFFFNCDSVIAKLNRRLLRNRSFLSDFMSN